MEDNETEKQILVWNLLIKFLLKNNFSTITMCPLLQISWGCNAKSQALSLYFQGIYPLVRDTEVNKEFQHNVTCYKKMMLSRMEEYRPYLTQSAEAKGIPREDGI